MTLALLAILGILLAALPAQAHRSNYCGHNRRTEGVYRVVFSAHYNLWGVHRHRYGHFVWTPTSGWLFAHFRTRICQ